MAVKTGDACLVTLTDRNSRFLIAVKAQKKNSLYVCEKMTELFSTVGREQVKTSTPDRGKEMDMMKDTTICRMSEKFNSRPRRCLGCKTPHEVFFNKVLHLI